MATNATARAQFTAFVEKVEPKLSFALAAAHGAEVGREATADALMYAWEHWNRISTMDNPAGYLYRVGQTNAKRHRRTGPAPEAAAVPRTEPWVEPALPGILADLPQRQRVAVVLIHGMQWTQREVADLLGVSRTTVERHLERGMRRLRAGLEVKADA
jgi:RNA polymerase sigma-70 factor (ECF subfamily)